MTCGNVSLTGIEHQLTTRIAAISSSCPEAFTPYTAASVTGIAQVSYSPFHGLVKPSPSG